MTAGTDALTEAARLEAARVYGKTLGQHRSEADQLIRRARRDQSAGDLRPTGPQLDAAISYWRKRGQSVASIAFRLGCTRGAVRAALERLERAS